MSSLSSLVLCNTLTYSARLLRYEENKVLWILSQEPYSNTSFSSLLTNGLANCNNSNFTLGHSFHKGWPNFLKPKWRQKVFLAFCIGQNWITRKQMCLIIYKSKTILNKRLITRFILLINIWIYSHFTVCLVHLPWNTNMEGWA